MHNIVHIEAHSTLLSGVWRSYFRSAPTNRPAEGVVSVGVRIRQKDVGVLYRKQSHLGTTPLRNYEPGEMLDFYA